MCRERRNIRLVIAYNGAAYHGWQRQAHGLDTVQERIETAAARIVGHPLSVHGAGRTDAGVHAGGQVANFHTSNLTMPLRGLRRAMNAQLPRDIAVRSAAEVPDDFQASRSALAKTYRYRIHVSPVRPVMLHQQVYHFWRPLEVPQMRLAARRLVGRHDFRGFAASGEISENTVRTIFCCRVSQTDCQVHVTVRGDGFLYNMVRIIAGTLIEIGRGRWLPERIDRILASCDRRDAGPTASPEGLILVCVHYDPAELGQDRGVAPGHPSG